uniref:Integrase, catalytic region, zinc finger, CCHC-type, peptidase aspartic, catalytic n=1 Tax=Tanacetum cinerariifolium TaxID=118510 RepID=A0A6L2JFJ3_TANCI|nr:integrase, catalytic region, zinc finger, CCHC-type, peptidase aspartic, catalytic [Tanacetum cinerariifolium]
MRTLAEFMIIVGADNRPPMLEKSLYDPWKSRMEFYMENKENGRMILDSVQNGPLVWPTITEMMVLLGKRLILLKSFKLIAMAKLPISFFKVFHQMLQEKKCELYDEFNKFTFVKGETLYRCYWRFSQLINNMNVINMSMRPVQVNIKFLNRLPLEWSRFVTDVKLARDFHTTNYA